MAKIMVERRATRRMTPLMMCCPLKTMALLGIFSLSLPKAIMLPENVMPPMKAEREATIPINTDISGC